MAMEKAGVINKGLIGKGAFGCVYLVENPDGEQFAVKVMEWARAGPTDKGVVENELRVLKELSHEHVLCYTDHFMDKGLMYIITEYCSGGDISGFLDQIGIPLPEDLLRVWLWQMACGLEYMHNHESGPILHRDLKPTNVFLTETGVVRLGDMGIARALDRPDAMAETFCGTPPYMSPEALYEKPYNSKTDIWSLGCCVVEMATLERAYDGSTLFILRNAVLKMRQPLPYEYSRELDELLSKMLRSDYDLRATASELLDDPVLEGCEDDEPMDLIRKHNLHRALAMHRRSSPSSTTMASKSLTTKVKADETILTLRESMANLKVILDEGEPITTYRIKVERRMRGRRRNDDTITNSASLQTVLYRSQSGEKTKTTKKTLKVPSKKPAAEPLQRDDTLSRTVLPSLTSTVTSIGRSMKAGQPAPEPRRASRDAIERTGDASRAGQMGALRNTLAQVMGGEALRQARALVGSTANRQELTQSISSLTGDYQDLLSNIVIYLLLMESVNPSATDV